MVMVGIVALLVLGVCGRLIEPTTNSRTADHPDPRMRNSDEKRYMLGRINDVRRHAGVAPVSLGYNAAAQLHAESGLDNCIGAHWGVDGLKPYMRYSLAGGFQYNAENWAGLGGCVEWYDFYEPIGDVEERINEAMELWMDSEGHRETLLDPHHRRVNIGLAWDRYYLHAVQHFEGDYVQFDYLPTIEENMLVVVGETKDGLIIEDDRALALALTFDPPPFPLSKGQLSRTSCYGFGPPIVGIRPPPPRGHRYAQQKGDTVHASCPDPYEVPPDTLAPGSPREGEELNRAMRAITPSETSVSVPLVVAQRWRVTHTSFEIIADVGDQLKEYGRGVYTVVVGMAIFEGEALPLSQYSIFHDVTPPSGYAQYAPANQP